MTAKLDRLPISEEIKVWDLSLLSPEDQDRAKDLMDLIQGSTDMTGRAGNDPTTLTICDLSGACGRLARLWTAVAK
jgi:hypothetical protein